MVPNPFLLAADNSPELLPLLRENPALASAQDDHGYSLIHAAASYNHLNLLRTLVRELHVDVDLKDEDDETALFVVETPDAPSCSSSWAPILYTKAPKVSLPGRRLSLKVTSLMLSLI